MENIGPSRSVQGDSQWMPGYGWCNRLGEASKCESSKETLSFQFCSSTCFIITAALSFTPPCYMFKNPADSLSTCIWFISDSFQISTWVTLSVPLILKHCLVFTLWVTFDQQQCFFFSNFQIFFLILFILLRGMHAHVSLWLGCQGSDKNSSN